MAPITIAIDAMGGDHGPSVTVSAALQALQQHSQLHLILVGDEVAIQQQFVADNAVVGERLKIHPTTQVVAMDESPASALRGKKDSSMRVAINLVKEGTADACVSAGNTGALMATARFVLKTIPGIDRPAIISEIPVRSGTCRMLDLGANVDSEASHLLQFAVMGSVLTSAVEGIAKPTVGLLNVGVEEIKGNEQVKQAAQLLSQCDAINYIGYVEGDTIYKEAVDVVVCDGFVGNVALKTSEGVAKLIAYYLGQAFRHNLYSRVAALIAKPVLMYLKRQIDPARYNGATFAGLRGIVIKSHGGANTLGFTNAIREAVVQVQQNVPQMMREKVADVLLQEEKE